MDNFFLFGDVVGEVTDQAKSIQGTWKESHFTLMKWMANSPKIISEWPEEEWAKEINDICIMDGDCAKLPITKALGIIWDCDKDQFTVTSR